MVHCIEFMSEFCEKQKSCDDCPLYKSKNVLYERDN